jgi:hypothetical protein
MTSERIRESVIAGTWYPGHAAKLTAEIRRHLGAARVTPLTGSLIGLIVPHAGYRYSGGVAAYAYKLLQDHPCERVIIVAPSHRALFQGASIYALGGYRTPLGVVALDRELIDALFAEDASIRYVPQADAQEHSLEIQLPFLQVVNREFRLTPIVMGEQTAANCRMLAAALAKVCRGRRVLLVASSDLSHFHSYDAAKRLDRVVLERVASFDPEGLQRELNAGSCEACGAGPMIAVMQVARQLGASRCQVLHYANSGDVTGDHSGVVGYMSAALIDNPGGADRVDAGARHEVGIDLGFNAAERRALLDIARAAIRSKALNEPLPKVAEVTDKLKEWRTAFVTLKIQGKLRGCIGCLEPRGPLHQVVQQMAVQAAFCDPRFSPLQPQDVDRIEVEISVLTPPEPVRDPGDIELGRHGLVIRKGAASGLLLPQVATENGWTREEFLEWTCRKAGLPTDAWRQPGTQILSFSADVFGEK